MYQPTTKIAVVVAIAHAHITISSLCVVSVVIVN
jgi:hypothetical protein